jgi:hypothetical protein
MPSEPVHLLVFRDSVRPASGSVHKSAFARQLHIAQNRFQPEEVLRALLRAGELECGVADSGAPVRDLENLTDILAEALVRWQPIPDPQRLLALLDAAPIPEKLTISVPEGFAYYGLHPLGFAEVLGRLPKLPERVAVVGIRSIGTTLSAVTAAALRQRDCEASRITVRPVGHPYDRRTEFSGDQTQLVKQQLSLGASFLVVDEGPGLSGSSFLSVAEALVRAGVAREKITLICSHAPQPERLCAENAEQRCREFRWVEAASPSRKPEDAVIWVGGGEWRRFFVADEDSWPACWPNFERQKYLSGEIARRRFYKFLGFGHYGSSICEREQCVAAAGFGPPVQSESHGFYSYPLLDAEPMRAGHLSASMLEHLAAYCAFRARVLTVPSAETGPLQQMAEHNLQELKFDAPLQLRLERPVIADGRMQPHEWLLTRDGRILKTDSGSHGDDHFFPGPTDIAWDLAGAIVEWQMGSETTKAFLEAYSRMSGDDPKGRIGDYLIAYAVFRHAWCRMAASAVEDQREQQRLRNASAMYRAGLMEMREVQTGTTLSMAGVHE